MKKTNTNRIISSIIIAMMVVTSLIIPVSATETEATPTLPLVYQSSIGFTTESSTWGTDGVWSAEIYDKTTDTYSAMTAQEEEGGKKYLAANTTRVNGTEIYPSRASKANFKLDKVPTKTFTAPYDGHINISYANVEGATYAGTADAETGEIPQVQIIGLGKTQGNTNVKFRITKTKNDGTRTNLINDIDYYTDGKIIDLDDESIMPSIMIKEGEKIRFEVERTEGNEGSDYHGLYCDPVITYNYIGDVAAATERNTFKSSEFFDATNNSGIWDGGVWSAYAIDNASDAETYATLMTAGNTLSFSGNLASVTPIEIKPISGNQTTADNLNIGGAKVFTAPKSGTILISFADVTEANGTLINGVKKRAWNQAAKFRITKQSATGVAEKIYPNSADYIEAAKNSGDILVPSNEIVKEVNVNQGDKIYFEAFRTDKSNPWNGIYCDPIITYIPSIDSRTTFKSSEYFNVGKGDGTWENGVWSAETVNPETNVYTKMTCVVKNTDFGNVYAPTSGGNDHYVGAERISPPTNGQWSTADLRTHWAAKTFTAPFNGRITVSCVNDQIISNDGSYPKVRVRFESNGEFKELLAEKSLSWGGNPVSQGTYDVNVKQGDKIHFEVLRTHAYSSDNNGTIKYNHAFPKVYWDPVITYLPAPADRTTFRSAEFYDTTGETAKWDNGVWQAWFYDWNKEGATTERDKYQLMKGTREDDGIVKWANNEKSEAGDYNYNGNAAQIGPEFMRVELIPYESGKVPATEYEKTYQDAIYGYPIGRDYPVKVFKAPKTGVVSIGAHVMAAPAADKGVRVRIMKMNATSSEPVQVWPYSGFKTYAAGETINFTPVTTALAEGDMLMFECVFKFGEGFSSPYAGTINWDPTVTYTDGVAINNIGTEFKSGEDIVTGVTNIATAANLTATIPVYSGTAFEKAIVVVGIYDSNDMLVRVGMSEDISISATEPNNVPVTFGAAASEIESGSIKVFLWEGLSSLAPVAAAMPIQ